MTPAEMLGFFFLFGGKKEIEIGGCFSCPTLIESMS
jgi:hypothetical protein